MRGPSRRSSAWPSCTRGSDFVVTRDVMARARCKTRMCGSFGQNPLWFRMLGPCLPPSLSVALRGSIQNVKNFPQKLSSRPFSVPNGSEGDFCEQAPIFTHTSSSPIHTIPQSGQRGRMCEIRMTHGGRSRRETRSMREVRSRGGGSPVGPDGLPPATLAPTWNPVTCASQRLGHRRPGRQQSGHR